jgi:hypothetical protein
MTKFASSPLERASTPATPSAFSVRSRCRRDALSGRNSASAIAPEEPMPVEERKSRLSAVLRVNAVRRD